MSGPGESDGRPYKKVQDMTVTAKIVNPVLSGFHPDPSLVRAGDVYYLANSTFEWWPGVRMHESRDLAHWSLMGYALDRRSQLDMRGDPSSGGVWAPDLSYADGRFWLVYSDVKVVGGAFKDCVNYLVTAEDVHGPWSDPVRLNGVGFDASLFHDMDGRKYLVQQTWDFRAGHHRFDGITLTEFDPATMRLMPSTKRTIWRGTDVGLTEGPHLYHIGDWYYLFCAEGGTSYEHQESVARSRSLDALSFEGSPRNPFISDYCAPRSYLQKQGHGALVDTPSGEWYYASLCGRPWRRDAESLLSPRGWCTLGRETSIQKVEWDDEGWPYVVGGPAGLREVDAPGGAPVYSAIVAADSGGSADCAGSGGPAGSVDPVGSPAADTASDAIAGDAAKPVAGRSYGPIPSELDAVVHEQHDRFDDSRLGLDWNTLRVPFDGRMGEVGGGRLTLFGQGSLCNPFELSLVARRWQDFEFDASTCLEFRPDDYMMMAGLTNYYCDQSWSWAYVTWDGKRRTRVIEVADYDFGRYSDLGDSAVPVPDDVDRVWLRTRVRTSTYAYEYSFDGKRWRPLPGAHDAALLSDDYIMGRTGAFFTGAFVGLAAVDLTGYRTPAHFYGFDYMPCRR